jgi:hypothetical protein
VPPAHLDATLDFLGWGEPNPALWSIQPDEVFVVSARSPPERIELHAAPERSVAIHPIQQ